MTAGYSGTPLAEKIGLRRGMRCWFHNMPEGVRRAIDPERLGLEEQQAATEGLQCAWLFVTERGKLERELGALRQLIAPNGFIWVSWPKAAKHPTEIAEDRVRDVALPLGLVDTKSCAIDEIWSGLRLGIRREHRSD